MRRRSTFGILLLLIVTSIGVIGVIGLPEPARAACTCSATTAEQGMSDASEVFLGSLTDISPPTAEGLVNFDFDVRLVYKGEVPATITVATFATVEGCGFGDTARRGEWLVFTNSFEGADAGPPLLTTCSPSGPLTSSSVLPTELGQGRAPPGAEAYVPALAATQHDTFVGAVTDPRDTVRSILGALAVLVVVGVGARLLAGRRRLVVR